MSKVILSISGMSCSACSKSLEKYLNKQKGIINASVNLVLAQALIQYDNTLTIKDLNRFASEVGFKSLGIYDEKKENKAVDIYNILSIESKLCLGAHDIDKVDGNVTLKITDGTEKFLPLGSEELKPVKAREYSFVDDNNEVICWLDISQVDKTKVTEDSKNVLYLIIGNKETTDEELEKVTNNLISLTTKFASGKATIVK